MKHPLLAAVTSVLLATAAGCAGSAQYSATATVSTPELILIEPDVQVVADYNEPVFYSENYYWRYDNGVWYRSNNHVRGWVRFEAVPARIRRIERPTAYIHYRGEARGQTRTEVRDHRDHQPAPPPPVVNNPPPVVYTPPPPPPRDHNADRKEVRDDLKDLRKDAKEERKEATQDAKRDAKDDRKDAKEERKDARQDAKEERKEAKQDAKRDAKDDRKDAKEERKEAKQDAKRDAKDDRKDDKKHGKN